MHMMSRKDLSLDELDWILCKDPGTPRWYLQPVEKCIQTRKHKYMFTV